MRLSGKIAVVAFLVAAAAVAVILLLGRSPAPPQATPVQPVTQQVTAQPVAAQPVQAPAPAVPLEPAAPAVPSPEPVVAPVLAPVEEVDEAQIAEAAAAVGMTTQDEEPQDVALGSSAQPGPN